MAITVGGPPAGEDERAPLTWGQMWPWLETYRPPWTRGFGNVEVTCPVPPSLTISATVAAVRQLLARHVGLRSRIVLGAEGEPWQVPHSPESVELPVLDVSVGDGGPGQGHGLDADDEQARLAAAEREFFYNSGLALDLAKGVTRAVILAWRGSPRRIALSVHHVALDLTAAEVLSRELSEVVSACRDGRQPDLPAVSLTPLEQARSQRSAVARRRSDAAVSFWEGQLRSIPQTLFPQARPGAGSRAVYQVDLHSPAAYLAATVLSRRFAAPTPTVCLSALVAVLAASTGFRRIAVEVQSANRVGPDQAGLVASQALPAQVVTDVDPNQSIELLVRRTAQAMLIALRHGACDHISRLERTVRTQQSRGVRFYAPVEFNYLRGTDQVDPDVSAEDVAAAQRLSQLTVTPLHWHEQFHAGLSEQAGAARVRLYVPRRALERDQAESLVRGYESVLVQAVLHPEASVVSLTDAAGVRLAPQGEGWELVDHNLVRPDVVTELLASHPEVRAAHVVVDRSTGGPALRAHIAVDGAGGLTPGLLHRWVVQRLARHPAAAAPARYSLYATPPADVADEAAWSACPVLADGDGRAPEPLRPPSDERERLLLEVLARNAVMNPSLDDCYVEAGGSLARVPAILAELAAAGWTGIDLRGFEGMQPLGELSQALRAAPVGGLVDSGVRG